MFLRAPPRAIIKSVTVKVHSRIEVIPVMVDNHTSARGIMDMLRPEGPVCHTGPEGLNISIRPREEV